MAFYRVLTRILYNLYQAVDRPVLRGHLAIPRGWLLNTGSLCIVRNVLGKSSKHLDCGSIEQVVLLVCLCMHSTLWRHDVGFFSQTSLFVTETFHAEWQPRFQGFSAYVATTPAVPPRQQLSPNQMSIFFQFRAQNSLKKRSFQP